MVRSPGDWVEFAGRRAAQLENESLRVTLMAEGGHVAEIRHNSSGVNPLWRPPWPTMEHSAYDAGKHPEYGQGIDGRLLAGILGHNLCLDTFGAPSPEETAAGMPVHGEASSARYEAVSGEGEITLRTTLEKAHLGLTRRVRLADGSDTIRFQETVENLSAADRPIAWTEHVTLGPPFLERGETQFQASATRSRVGPAEFTDGYGQQVFDAEFEWPDCPCQGGGVYDLRTFTGEAVSGAYTMHLMDTSREHAYFLAWSPRLKLLLGYVWQRQDFPWLGRWEENHLRTWAPWNGQTLACGMEFGVSPVPESRREMVNRGRLFGVPTFRWVPAKSSLSVEYCAFLRTVERMPAGVSWDGAGRIELG